MRQRKDSYGSGCLSNFLIFQYKIIKTFPQAQTDLGRPKHVWTVEMRTRTPRGHAHPALKNFSLMEFLVRRV
ncbi:hypothetical protein RHMOL_Rhmol13G0041700 [Rhododendron molle]|uniref:Uncharacterized protein n=1 Tax=Rhododendron molle TaxID=49168 RepID=A0ACC0L3W2_RHOML|nr:hypothetical protein RHMOL_Rhmol13G0041700 [Rhododendron molle]